MKQLRLCNVSDRYIDYLCAENSNVYANKSDTRIHMRKYLGVVITMNQLNYYIPLSSPKKTDYQVAGDSMVIKKSIVPIIRMTRKNKEGERELMGTLRISHMIPVPDSELIEYNLDEEPDSKYKELIENELTYIRINKERIIKAAQTMYNQKESGYSAGYVERALDYSKLEKMCVCFMKKS